MPLRYWRCLPWDIPSIRSMPKRHHLQYGPHHRKGKYSHPTRWASRRVFSRGRNQPVHLKCSKFDAVYTPPSVIGTYQTFTANWIFSDVQLNPTFIALVQNFDEYAVKAMKLKIWPVAPGAGSLDADTAGSASDMGQYSGFRQRGVMCSLVDVDSLAPTASTISTLVNQYANTRIFQLSDQVAPHGGPVHKVYCYCTKLRRPVLNNANPPTYSSLNAQGGIFVRGENFLSHSVVFSTAQIIYQITWYVTFYGQVAGIIQ